MRRADRAALILPLVLLTTHARADAGTPLMWTEYSHLVFGNALIGVAEGALLATMFGATFNRGMLMIPANYLSMIAGCVLMAFLPLPGVTIGTFWISIAAAVAIFFAVTVVIEWPFAWLMLRKVPRRFSRSVYGILLVNVLSYAALTPIYLCVSDASLLSETHHDQTLLTDQPADESVYFLSTDLRHLCRVSMDGASLETVAEITQAPESPQLVVAPLAPGRWQIAVESSHWSGNRVPLTDVSANQMVPHDPPPRLETPTGRRWLVVHTPFVTWWPRCASNLPGDRTIFQLGDQIVLLHTPTMRLALITRGLGPVVALSSSAEE